MRLEVESNDSGFSPLNGNVIVQNSQEKFAEYLNAGVRAAQSGDRKSARKNLMSALDIDPQSENAWLWLASISEYPEELLVFLNNVLDINPKNERALQWSASTKLLLSKTLVQRGIDAHENGRRDFAIQCFDQALSYDMHNVTAWLWLAALNDSEECRLEYFQRVLEIDPENETARTAIDTAEAGKRDSLYSSAAWCGVNGDIEGAKKLLSELFGSWPNDKDAWLLKSHIAVSLNERREACERILEIDRENDFAMSCLASLARIMQTANSHLPKSSDVNAVTEMKPAEHSEETPTEFVLEATVETKPEEESIPTGDLVPNDAYFADEQPIEVLNSPTQESEPAYEFDRSDDGYDLVPATIYEPTEPDSAVVDLDPSTDPFSSIAEPVVEQDVMVVDDRLKILVVENNPTARKLMAGKLENSGYSVICAESGREAVDLAKSTSPSLVLADIAMPGMDGYAVCRSLRDMELHDLPIILISGKDGFYEEELGEAAGASGFITKPFGPETLMKMIEGFLTAAPNR